MWTFADAMMVVWMIQEDIRQFGYHVALGGGVLNNGASDKDLDLYFLPLGENEEGIAVLPDDLVAYLEMHFGDAKILEGYPDENSPWYSKLMFSWADMEDLFEEPKYRRIDAFILDRR